MTPNGIAPIEQKQSAFPASVRLRPDKGNWAMVILFAIFSLFPLTLLFLPSGLTSGQNWLLIGAWDMMTLLPALLLGVWQARAVVIADKAGIRWRGMGDWHSAQWVDVTDYYERLSPKGKLGITLESTAGKLSLNPGLWAMTSELKGFVTQHATRTQAKEWKILGLRSEVDWPRVFDYNTGDNRFVRYVMPGMMFTAAGFYFWPIIPGFSKTLASLGVGWALATVGISLFGLLPVGLMFWLISRMSSATTRRQSQHITLTLDGVIYESKDKRIAARWEEITDLFIAPRRGGNIAAAHVVVTQHGTFDFLSSIREYAILCRALPIYAAGLAEAKWRSSETDILGGAASRWTSRREGVGKRIYHYRTRTNRALLWFPTAVTVTQSALHWALAPLGIVTANTGVLTCFVGLTLWGWWRYSAAGIETDETGITQKTLFGTRHLAWGKVTDYNKSGADAFVFGVVKSETARLWFWMGIADVEHLKAEIARFAVNSFHQTWATDTQDGQSK